MSADDIIELDISDDRIARYITFIRDHYLHSVIRDLPRLIDYFGRIGARFDPQNYEPNNHASNNCIYHAPTKEFPVFRREFLGIPTHLLNAAHQLHPIEFPQFKHL